MIYAWNRRWLRTTVDAGTFEPPYQPDETGYVDLSAWGPGPTRQPLGYALTDFTEHHRCVVLLGEPGIGKSQEWQQQQTQLRATPRQVFLDLGTIASEDTLRYALLEDPQIQAWLTDDSILTLWLDSLDEGLLHLATLQAALRRVLHPLPLSRLCLRIMCRNAVWPVALSEALANLLHLTKAADPDAFQTLLLSPLSRDQVAQAATAEQVDAEAFLAAVAAADAQPLASRPVTLALLLLLYRQHQPGFGPTEAPGRSGLYELGCLALCERPDRQRSDAHRPDARTRLLLAGFVAMLSVLANRRILLAEPAADPLTTTELDPHALGGGPTVSWRGQQATIGTPQLRDLFRNTGLFTDLGGGRLVWAHQSYAEFLAAWYLSLTDLPPGSLRPLFRSAADPQGGLVPALRETAGWLADLQPAFWDELLELDPLVLLSTDLRLLGVEQRTRLVQRLLTWAGGRATLPYQSPDFLRRLQHPGLASQLAPLLGDSTTSVAAASLAVDLARAAEVRALQPQLLAQALDPAESFKLRLQALTLLVDLADEPTRGALRPLQHAIPAEDEADEFRGFLLRLLWPAHLALDELFDLLLPPDKGPLFGAYNQFLDQLLDLRLAGAPARVLTGLTWLAAHAGELKQQEHTADFWRQAAHQLQRAAWQLVEEAPLLVGTLADAFIASVDENRPFVIAGTAAQRLAVTAELLRRPIPPEPMYVLYHSADSSPHVLISPADWEGLLNLLYDSQLASVQHWLAEALALLLRNTPTAPSSGSYVLRFGQLAQAAKLFPPVHQVLVEWTAPLDLTSPKTGQLRQQHYAEIARRRQAAYPQRVRRLRTQHRHWEVRQLVRRVQLRPGATPSFNRWANLLYYFSRERSQFGFPEVHDLTSSRRWARLGPVPQAAVLATAWHFLKHFTTPPADWYQLGHGIKGVGIALFRTLLLCYRLQPNAVRVLPTTFWANWAAFILHVLTFSDRKLVLELLQLAAQAAPAAVDEAIIRQTEAYHNRGEFSPFELGNLTRLLPAAGFPAQLLAVVTAQQWQQATFNGQVLVELLKADYVPAWHYVRDLIPAPAAMTATDTDSADKVIVEVYRWLLFDRERTQADHWEWWQRLMRWPGSAAAVIRKALRMTSYSVPRFWVTLSDTQLATFMQWLTNTYCLLPDDTNDWQSVGPDYPVVAARTAAAAELAGRGTSVAVELLRELQTELGNPHWLGHRLDEARENLRRNAWEPLPPEGLALLSREANRRWVRSAADLQDLLLESLDRFQADLQGEPTTAEVLWVPLRATEHRSTITGYEVREENYFSNVLRQHFRQDLVRANLLIKRELEIRPSLGVGTGQRTDIFVEAFTRGPGNEKTAVVTVVIEVKLSANKEAETALSAQLRGYLADQAYKHGIFLVGWHFGQYKAKPAARLDQAALLVQLNQQAAALAPAYHIKARVLDIRLPADTSRGKE